MSYDEEYTQNASDAANRYETRVLPESNVGQDPLLDDIEREFQAVRDSDGDLYADGGEDPEAKQKNALRARLAERVEETESPWQEKRLLDAAYTGLGMTTRECAQFLGCTNGTISRYLNEYGIETRENWKAGSKAGGEASRVEYVQLRTLPSGYEYWGARIEGVMRILYVHRLLAISESGVDAVAENDVHHKNGIPWDNRPENIEILDPAEHRGMHSQEYWGAKEGEV